MGLFDGLKDKLSVRNAERRVKRAKQRLLSLSAADLINGLPDILARLGGEDLRSVVKLAAGAELAHIERTMRWMPEASGSRLGQALVARRDALREVLR